MLPSPDLAERIQHDWEWTPYNRDTFYTPLKDEGYLDYAIHGQRGHGEIAAEKKGQSKANI